MTSSHSNAPKLLTYSTVLCWHPSLNVYVLDDKAVLLISSSRQLLLSSNQFPLLALIDGHKSAKQILQTVGAENQGVGFLYQVNQLYQAGLLVASAIPEVYISSLTDRMNVIDYRELAETCQLLNLSALADTVISDVEAILSAVLLTTTVKAVSVILVDDMIDARIANLSLQRYFMVIKISGEDIWFSPIFKTEEMIAFVNLQQRVLANQPVRKWLMARWSHRKHGFTFVVKRSFGGKLSQVLAKLFLQQLQSDVPAQLLVYHVMNEKLAYHPVDMSGGNDTDFSAQLGAPIRLQSCIGRFNQDGGSRSVSPDCTVDKLMPLVSSVSGVISHLEVLEYSEGEPVKIYQTGYFKPYRQLTSKGFEQHGFIQICLGKGVSDEQSKASALAEAIERYCALYQNDVPLIKSTEKALSIGGKRFFSYQQLVPYSAQQYLDFDQSRKSALGPKHAVKAYDQSEIHWLPCWSLTMESVVYLPLSLCFSNLPFDDEQFGRWHSNGCAAGNTLEEAILQGLFELIERDATAIWWYNQVSRPLFDLSRLEPDNLVKLTKTLAPTHEFWVLDVTNDIGIPVMVAIGKDKTSGGWVMGFGCHLSAELAAQRALTELCQLIPIRDQNRSLFDFDAIVEDGYFYANDEAQASAYLITATDDIKQDIVNIVSGLKTLGFETLALNYSRAYVHLHTVKVFVPGLLHIWPQLANQRLYQLPVELGWLQQPNTSQTINQQSLNL